MNEADAINEISVRMMELARNAHGQRDKANRLVELAASLELLSDEVQQCWGGPLNGQVGRQAIFRQLLGAIEFDVILETGTFRGITTQWFAENFSGSIASCDQERLYILQAQHRLSGYAHVKLHLKDSREFLREQLGALPPRSKVLFYLDAHWHKDLPLAEELRIIVEHEVNAVIAVDDFRVPGDGGYAYDDYGVDQRISLELVAFLKDRGFTFFFPKLPSNQESGAVRGVCILSKTLADELRHCDLICGGNWDYWRTIEMNESQLIDGELTAPSRSNLGAEGTALIASMIEQLHRDLRPSLLNEMQSIIRSAELELGDRAVEELRLFKVAVRADIEQIATQTQRFGECIDRMPDMLSNLGAAFHADTEQIATQTQRFGECIDRMPDMLSNLEAAFHADIVQLLARTEGIREVIQGHLARLDPERQESEERKALGRALVEERARVLDLQRQNHMLRDQVHQSNEQYDQLRALIGDGQLYNSIQCVVNELACAQHIASCLALSRAIKAVSRIAPTPRVLVLQLVQRLESTSASVATLKKLGEDLREIRKWC